MKQLINILILLILSFSHGAYADNNPKTVLDYFKLLPDKYFEVPEVKTQWVKRKSTVVDIANGYLSLEGDGAQSSLIVALFKKVDKTYTIGVYSNSPDNNDLNFYNYNQGQWQDITTQVLPKEITTVYLHNFVDGVEDTNFAHNIKMPRQGTTLIIENAEHKKLYELIWQKQKGSFQLKKVN